MVGQFLFWMQECKKQVFVVATANDVSMLPSELLRRGRFDELFFVDLPTADERRDILSLYMRKYLNLEFSGEFADKVVEISDGFTGADLESTVRDLAYRSIANANFILSEENIVTAFNNVVPLSQTSPEKIEAIRDWGKGKSSTGFRKADWWRGTYPEEKWTKDAKSSCIRSVDHAKTDVKNTTESDTVTNCK